MYGYRNLVFFFSMVILFSCENSDPGCLDLNAENFDVFAVSECDSCCVYPAGNINLAFRYMHPDTDSSFTFNTKFPYVGTDSIVVSDFQLPLSQFTFFSDQTSYKIRDTIRGQSPRIYDDYVLKERSSADIEIGKTSFVTELNSVSFSLGLEKDFVLGLRPFEDVEQKTNFINVIDDMYVDTISRLFQARIDLIVGESDSLRKLELTEILDPDLIFPISVSMRPGIKWTFGLDIDMKTIVDGIRPEDTNEMMAATISRNISKSFLVR